jgi:hypothetical protein
MVHPRHRRSLVLHPKSASTRQPLRADGHYANSLKFTDHAARPSFLRGLQAWPCLKSSPRLLSERKILLFAAHLVYPSTLTRLERGWTHASEEACEEGDEKGGEEEKVEVPSYRDPGGGGVFTPPPLTPHQVVTLGEKKQHRTVATRSGMGRLP